MKYVTDQLPLAGEEGSMTRTATAYFDCSHTLCVWYGSLG